MVKEAANHIITDDELESLSYHKVAELLELSYSEVRKLVYTGQLKSFLATPRRPRIRKKILLQYIEEREKEDI